ncbi:MAG: flippase-like domain-containing protein [Acidobacteria bacterium]|nr:MAG: flippase-like domain-containing protein [Acidobacteriota bacterium]
MVTRVRSVLTWAVKLLVSGGLLYWLLSRVDRGQLWDNIQHAAPAWLLVALALYFVMILVSAWRWKQLLDAQHVSTTFGHLTASYLVATFFNNFLPSNIGGDVIRIGDTAPAAGSKTRAATIVLFDRGIGLIGLVLVAALGATIATQLGDQEPFDPLWLWLGLGGGTLAIAVTLTQPGLIGKILTPLRVFHQEWVDERINQLLASLEKFAARPSALVRCLLGSVVVQVILVWFYAAIARAMGVPMPAVHLAVLIPMSFVVQMLPVSVNGFGVREAIFGLYFAKLGLPRESAIALSFLGAALIMLFSVSGAFVMLARKSHAKT